MEFTIQEKMNARMLSLGIRTKDTIIDKGIDIIKVYCYTLQNYNYSISNIDENDLEEIRKYMVI